MFNQSSVKLFEVESNLWKGLFNVQTKIHVKQDLRNKNELGNFDNHQERLMEATEDEIRLSKAENNELSAELGQITVEKTARESEQNNNTLSFQNDNNNTLQGNHENTTTSQGYGNGFPKPRARNADPASLVSQDASSGQALQGAESLLKENDHQQGKEGMVKNDKDERNLHGGDENRAGISVIASKRTSGGEGVDHSGSVSGTSNVASTSREGNVDQTSTEQSYESLSFSVQQDYSNEKEKISLSNVPPTSVATTLYNNYKLLLLSLGQLLLSSDVEKLMSWATQNFPVVNPENATHVLFQLDESGVINATDLSQLRHFFESTVRFDLVYIIDAFLVGDYAILRRIPASKKRDARTTQNSQHGTTTRYSNFFNQTRSPNENQSIAYGATGFTESRVVDDDPVTSKFPCSFV